MRTDKNLIISFLILGVLSFIVFQYLKPDEPADAVYKAANQISGQVQEVGDKGGKE
jgi:hypothetical protein